MKPILPRITVVTPSYNQGGFIEQTIASVLSQDYPDLEYIVMDGGSTDDTIPILRRHEDRLRWISERDNGQAHAINKALKIATGEVLAYLNSDDGYEPDALKAVGEFFAEHPEAFWVTGKCRVVDSAGREIRKAITLYKNLWLRLHSGQVLYVLNYVSQPATFWRHSVMERVGLFNEDLHYTMDYDYWLRMERVYRLHFVNTYLARFRIHAASKSGTTAFRQFDEQLAVARSHTRNPVLLNFHIVHNVLATRAYAMAMKKPAR